MRRGAPLLLLAACLAWTAACSSLRPVPPAGSDSGPPEASEPAAGPTPPPVAADDEPLPEVRVPDPGAPDAASPRGEVSEGRISPPVRRRGPILLRIGLESDLERVDLECCAGGRWLEMGGRRLAAAGPVTVTPGVAAGSGEVLRLQVAALRDDAQAEELARSLARRWGWPADAHFDAGVGLYRVRAGRFPDRATAETAQRRLAADGTRGAWIVREGELTRPALRLTTDGLAAGDGRATLHPGRWLRLATGEGGFTWKGRSYRGDLLVFLNSRGTLNVVNQVLLEDYLRGVVPAEMGPVQYDRLQSLKAQAVAARTFTLRNLGGFRDEGYDLCATPRCQVYGGRSAEHPLSDRAVAETAGQVLVHQGELVDARYSATCGGHTEDLAVVFPDEGPADYLRGVPCIEAGGAVLEGAALEGSPFPLRLTRRLLPPPAGATPAASLDERLVALARRAGLPTPAATAGGRLQDLTAGAVRRRVAGLFDLALSPRLLSAETGLAARAADPPPAWSAEDRRQAALLAVTGVYGQPAEAGGGEAPVGELEAEMLLLQLARLTGVVEVEEMAFRSVEVTAASRRLRAQAYGEPRELGLTLPPDLATYRRGGGGLLATDLTLAPGDPVSAWWARPAGTGVADDDGAGRRLLALVQEVDPAHTVADAPHARSAWRRFKSHGELARLVEERYPGLGFSGLEVLSRGVSGRVGAIRIFGSGERSVVVEGLAVRWTLDLPDTRFEMTPARGGFAFRGTGWGHGVGLCQSGSFAMAGRGVDYRHILSHYYSGVILARANGRAPWWERTAAVSTPAR